LLIDPGVVADGPYTIRQTMQGDNLDLWEADTFQNSQDSSPAGLDVYYMTNGVEMMSWDGSDDQVAWFYPGFVGKNLLVMQQALAFWNIVDAAGDTKPGSIYYSELNYPENFTTNGAGTILPSDGVLDLLTCKRLGDQIVCYYQGSIILLQWVGKPLYWIARMAVPRIGLIAQKAVMDHGDYHEFLSRAGAYRFDGVALTEAMPQLFREVLRTASPPRVGRSYAALDEENGEVLWSIPLSTDGQTADQPPTKAYSQHYLEDVGSSLPDPMMIREFPFTAVGFYESTENLLFSDIPRDAGGQFDASALKWNDRELQEAFPLKIAGDANGDIYVLNTSNLKAGDFLYSYATFARKALVDGERKGLLEWIEPFCGKRGVAAYSLSVAAILYDYAEGPGTTSYASFDLRQQGLRYAPIRKAGRYAGIQFSSLGIGAPAEPLAAPWDLSGYRVKVSVMGDR
jgi:hypothetical protein